MDVSRVVAAVNWAERRRSLIYPALMSLGVSVLASCAEKPARPPVQAVAIEPPPPPPPLPPRRRVFPLPAHKPSPPPETAANTTESEAEAMALASPQPVARAPQASQLIGLDQPAATRLFGSAAEKSEAPPATIWRYRNATCELDLFFYLDLRSGKMRTLHFTVKDQSVDQGSREDCLRSLVVARSN
jgi:hypothetical protein